MIQNVKIGQEVLLFTMDGTGSPYIIRGYVSGALSKNIAGAKYIFQIQTSHGTIWRLASELWASVQDIKDDLENLVEE